jgi:hypothetical protein
MAARTRKLRQCRRHDVVCIRASDSCVIVGRRRAQHDHRDCEFMFVRGGEAQLSREAVPASPTESCKLARMELNVTDRNDALFSHATVKLSSWNCG